MHLDDTCFYGTKKGVKFGDAVEFCDSIDGQILKMRDISKIRFIKNELVQSRVMNNFNFDNSFFWLPPGTDSELKILLAKVNLFETFKSGYFGEPFNLEWN